MSLNNHSNNNESNNLLSNFKQELNIETNFPTDLNENLPSCNSSDFSVVYVDDSDGTNHSDFTANGNSSEETLNGKRSKNKAKNSSFQSSKYKFVTYVKEDYDDNIYNVQIYQPFEINPSRIVFATVGINRCSIYEYITSNGSVDLIDCYMDADSEEIYYSCAWSTDPANFEPLIVVGGKKGIIRTIVPFKYEYKNALIGHGSSINDLRFHPSKNYILLSASKDYTMRLWNVNTSVCIAIFGGAEGHTDQVLSGDFNLNGNFIMSCGIDHFLKMWNVNSPRLKKAIEDSETFNNNFKSFPTVLVNFPDFSTREVHTNYIDCVRWFGDLVLSKSCENCIIEWKPGLIEEKIDSIPRSSKNVSILHKFDAKECDIWYVRFGLDFSQKIMALGSSSGKVYVWNLDEEDPNDIKRICLAHAKSKKSIRAVALSMNGRDLIATNDCGNIFIWRLE